MNLRAWAPFGLIALLSTGASGCKKSEPPAPEPEAASASGAVANKTRPNLRNSLGPLPRIDPQAMKDYRLDICYYGTFTLRQARDAYLASLGKDEPSEKKLPNFGVPNPPPATTPTTGPSAGSAKAGAPPAPGSSVKAPPATPPGPKAPAPVELIAPKASAAAAASASAKTPTSSAPPADRRPYEFALRAPHERNARACSSILALKEPPMGDVDVAVAALAPFVMELAKDIVTTNSYYQREEYKNDKLAKGKELHKKLLEEFQKLDDLHDKLGAALTAWRKDHPPDPTKQEEGEKAAASALDTAQAILLGVFAKKIDKDAYKENVTKLDAAIVSLRQFSATHPDDFWSKFMIGAFELFSKSAKDLKMPEKGVDAEGTLNLINNFTSLIEARQRALANTMKAKGQMANPPAPNGLPAGHPPLSNQ